jgi:hypothetical protein
LNTNATFLQGDHPLFYTYEMKIFYIFFIFLLFPFYSSAQSIPVSKDSALKVINTFKERYRNEPKKSEKYKIYKEYQFICALKAYYFYPDPRKRFKENWRKDSIQVENKLKYYRKKYNLPANDKEVEGMENYAPLKSNQGVIFPGPDSVRLFLSSYPKIFHNEKNENTRYFLYRQNEIFLKLKDYYLRKKPQDAFNQYWKRDSACIESKMKRYGKIYHVKPVDSVRIHSPRKSDIYSYLDSIYPKNLIGFNPVKAFTGDIQMHYEFFRKNYRSLEIGIAWKLALTGNEIPTAFAYWGRPRVFEYLASDGFGIFPSYKFNLRKARLRTYLAVNPFYRNYWYRNKKLDLSDQDYQPSDIYWQSANHKIAGLNLLIGRQLLLRDHIFADFYCGAGIRYHLTHVTRFQEMQSGIIQTYNTPKEVFTKFIEPSVVFGVKIGIYSKRKNTCSKSQ